MAVEIPSTDLSLLQRVQQSGSQSAWDSFCNIYGPAVYGWARQQGLQASDSSDVTQETFRSVAEHIVGWKPGRFRSWLYTIFRSRLMDFYRSKQSSPDAAGGTDFHQFIEAVPEEPVALRSEEGRTEVRQLYDRAMQVIRKTVSEQHWTAFERVVVHGDTPQDVADDLNVSVWTVYKCRTRVLQRLTREFEGLDLQADFDSSLTPPPVA
ncbi:MAG: sigma-70 family RNA polymerase sigma factor [Planctomycetota bacterium]